MTKRPDIIAIAAPVTITAAEDGEAPKAASFNVIAYNGGPLNLAGWERPVVIDLKGLQISRNVVANLDHRESQRVGHVSEASKDDGKLALSGVFSAATPYRSEVVESAKGGFNWEASVEVHPTKIVEVDAGKTITVNGQTLAGPLLVTKKGTLSGFAFVSHGADTQTDVKIAAGAAHKGSKMKADVQAWVRQMLPSVDIEALSTEEVANLEADYEGREGKRVQPPPKQLDDVVAQKKAERDRIGEIMAVFDKQCDARPWEIDAIKAMTEEAIEKKWTIEKYQMAMIQASIPDARGIIQGPRSRDSLTGRQLEAAVCMTGKLPDLEKHFDEQTLEAASRRFKHGIGLKELFVLAAESNGYRQSGYNIDIEVQRAAFGLGNYQRPTQQNAAFGFSTLSLPNTLANVANKFLRQGWMSVDQTPLRVALVTTVRDFKQRSTVSLTGGFMFGKVAADGELKHAAPGELAYTNQADTYGVICAITRTDMVNDDLGALTVIPRRIGRGGMLKLNDIFWTEFLNNSTFFTSGNVNVSTGAGSALSLDGIKAAETIFMKQTDADGFPIGAEPRILLVPPTLKATALTLMNSQLTITGANTTLPNANIWQGRFNVESSAYMENTGYTGNSAAAWYLLADPNDIPVIEIVALNGRVEPQVETADAPFNVLGVQMRGFSDVGVNLQEFRGGVRSAGS